MRSHKVGFLVPPYNGRFFPHETFPPWRLLCPVFDILVEAMRRTATRAPMRHLEAPLFSAAKRVVAVAAGNLTPAAWHRRARVAIQQLEKVKRAGGVYVRAGRLTVADEQAIARAVDEVIASLIDVVAKTPLPDEAA